MEKYRKLKVIGKGSFGYAVLVQSVADRQTYVMKVIFKYYNGIVVTFKLFRLLMCQRWIANKEKMQLTRYIFILLQALHFQTVIGTY
jgi:hypothetical protein